MLILFCPEIGLHQNLKKIDKKSKQTYYTSRVNSHDFVFEFMLFRLKYK